MKKALSCAAVLFCAALGFGFSPQRAVHGVQHQLALSNAAFAEHELRAAPTAGILRRILEDLHTPAAIVKADLASFGRAEMSENGGGTFAAASKAAIPPGPTGLSMSQAEVNFVGAGISNYPVFLYGSSANWQTEIQAVINFAGTGNSAGTGTSGTGGNIYLPALAAGTYIPLTSSLTVYSNIHLIGAGVNVTWSSGTSIPDGPWSPNGGTWFEGNGTFPAIGINNVDRTTGNFFLQAVSASTTGYMYNTSALSANSNILILTTQGVPSAMATISTVNSHQSVTFTANVTASALADWLLQFGTITTGGASPVLSNVTNVHVGDVIYGGTSGAYGQITALNGSTATVSYFSGSAFTTSEPFFLLPYPLGSTLVASSNSWITQGVNDFTVANCGFYDFSDGIQVGGRSSPGIFYGGFTNVYVGGCTNWGMDLANCQHLVLNGVWIDNCATAGAGYGEFRLKNDGNCLSGGNLSISNLYCLSETNLTKGIVFEAWQNNSVLNDVTLYHVQNNAYGNVAVSAAAVTCSASTNPTEILYTNANQHLAVGQPVVLSNSNSSYTAPTTFYSSALANQIFVVTSVTSTYFTVALARVGNGGSSSNGADVTCNGAGGTIYVSTKGMPAIEGTSYGNGGVDSLEILNPDCESKSSATFYFDHTGVGVSVYANNITDSGTAASDVALCCRNAAYVYFRMASAGACDLDAVSNNVFYSGTITGSVNNGIINRSPTFLGPDAYTTVTGALDLGGQNNFQSGQRGGYHTLNLMNGGWVLPGYGIGQAVYAPGNNSTLSNSNGGICVASSASTGNWSWTLPAITGVSGSNIAGSLIGFPLTLVNDLYGNSGNTLTVTTSSSQGFGYYGNSKTSYSIPLGGSLTVVGCATTGPSGTSYFWVVLSNNGAS